MVRYIVHTPTPRYDRGNLDKSYELLGCCYQGSIKLAEESGCHSIIISKSFQLV
eukprot:gnl/Chilomastix_caulleri/3170.p1 GENE.gnl/Chilomastix_caulleri/3170~~gnl/Chilomastix_caulleri/3170.p1  ORF type:complete len:54 (+),score=4.10 gnl/Chilomastix_caulleri/3170:233-394(+)